MAFDKSKDHSQIMGGGLVKWAQNGKVYDRDFKEVVEEVTEAVAPAAMPTVQLKDFKPTPEPMAPLPEAPVVVKQEAPVKAKPAKGKKVKSAPAPAFMARDE